MLSDSSSSSERNPDKQAHDPVKQKKYAWGLVPAIVFVLLGFAVLPLVAGVLLAFLPMLLGWESVRADEWLLHSPISNFLFVFLSEVMTIGSIAWFIAYKKASFLKSVGLRRLRPGDLAYTIGGTVLYFVLFVATLIVADAVLPINLDQEQALGFDKAVTGLGLALAFVSLVVLPPLAEEIIFRGFFYGTLRSRLNFGWTTFITSTLFGALHLFGAADGKLLWIALVDTFVLSLVLCYVREKTGSIWASIGIHALKNGFVFLNLFIINAA